MPKQIRVNVFQKTGRTGFHFIWKDPATGKRKTKASGHHKKRDAERAAVAFEEELNRKSSPTTMTVADLQEVYDRDKLRHLSKGKQYAADAAFEWFAKTNCQRLSDVPDYISKFRTLLLDSELAPPTQNGYLKHFRSAMNWASENGYLAERIQLKLNTADSDSEMRGRPLTQAEFHAMCLEATELPHHETIVDTMTGLWHSGLRRGEAMQLSWDRDTPFHIDRSGEYWRFRIRKGAQKSKRHQLAPMVPEFTDWLQQRTAPEDRKGLVFNPLNRLGKRFQPDGFGKAVAAIGEAAGIVTDAAIDRHATCHDFRRSFADRYAKIIMPADLKKLMRHRSVETTMKYYVGRETDDLTARLHSLTNTAQQAGI